MLRTAGILLIIMCGFVIGRVNAATVPTIHQVYEAAHSGHLREAQAMMSQVLSAHPNSGKAHFVLAEILAAQQQFRRAAQELASARRLAPGLPFEKPQAVTGLTTRIQRGLYGDFSAAGTKRSGAGHSWVVIALFGLCLVLLMVVIRAMRKPQPVAGMGPATTPPMYGSPFNNLQGPFTPMTPYGGGFMSNLKTGLGIGAGMAAGEALVNHFIDGNRPGVGPGMQDTMNPLGNDLNAGNDLGGNDFGMNSDSGWGDDGALGGDDFSGMDDGSSDWN